MLIEKGTDANRTGRDGIVPGESEIETVIGTIEIETAVIATRMGIVTAMRRRRTATGPGIASERNLPEMKSAPTAGAGRLANREAREGMELLGMRVTVRGVDFQMKRRNHPSGEIVISLGIETINLHVRAPRTANATVNANPSGDHRDASEIRKKKALRIDLARRSLTRLWSKARGLDMNPNPNELLIPRLPHLERWRMPVTVTQGQRQIVKLLVNALQNDGIEKQFFINNLRNLPARTVPAKDQPMVLAYVLDLVKGLPGAPRLLLLAMAPLRIRWKTRRRDRFQNVHEGKTQPRIALRNPLNGNARYIGTAIDSNAR